MARDLLASAPALEGPFSAESGVLIDVGPKGSIDSKYAHKPSIISHRGALYHFYCAVSEEFGRGIDWPGPPLFEPFLDAILGFMQYLALLLGASALVFAAEPVLYRQSGADGWTRWAAREEIAPRTFVEAGALAISGDSNVAAHGGWERTVSGVEPGKWYRLEARYRTSGVAHESLQVLARLDWVTSAGKRAGQPEYAWRTEQQGEWKLVAVEAPAPKAGTVGVKLQLYLSNAPQGTVWWKDVTLAQTAPPAPRPVRVASINLRPRNSATPAASVDAFLGLVKAVPGPQDLFLLPEGITVVGTGKSYAEVAETVPGPTTERLGEMARSKKAYIAAGIYGA